MQQFASSTLLLSTRSLIRSAAVAIVTCVVAFTASAQGELVFVRQPVAQLQGTIQDIASAPGGGAYTIERPASPGSTLLSKLRRNGTVEWSVLIPSANLTGIDVDGAGMISACGESGGAAVAMRLGPDGTELWRTTLPLGSAYSLSLDAVDNGDLFVAWMTNQYCDSRVSKVSAFGSVAWTQQIGGCGGLKVAATPNGEVFYALNGNIVGRLSAAGQLVWSYNVSNSAVTIFDVCVDPMGAAVYCGSASGLSFGSPIGANDSVMFRILSGGAINWIRRFGTLNNDDVRRIRVAGTGFVITGTTQGRFGGPTTGPRNVWVAEMDSTGNLVWTNQIGSNNYDDVYGLSTDAQGGAFVLGDGGPMPGSGSTNGGQWIARFGYFDCFTDADGDTFGEDGDIVLSATACSNGLSFLDTDCDDTRAYVYPGAAELCDGLDNDCDGTIDEGFISTYCTSGTSTNGCAATMSSQGTPSTTAGSGFQVICSNVEGQRYGLILYGTNPGGALWAINGTSYICVAPPQGRTDSQTSGGTLGACDGTLSVDFNLYLATHPNSVGAPYSPGQYLYAQGWYRDPAAPKGTNLSNGIQFALCN